MQAPLLNPIPVDSPGPPVPAGPARGCPKTSSHAPEGGSSKESTFTSHLQQEGAVSDSGAGIRGPHDPAGIEDRQAESADSTHEVPEREHPDDDRDSTAEITDGKAAGELGPETAGGDAEGVESLFPAPQQPVTTGIAGTTAGGTRNPGEPAETHARPTTSGTTPQSPRSVMPGAHGAQETAPPVAAESKNQVVERLAQSQDQSQNQAQNRSGAQPQGMPGSQSGQAPLPLEGKPIEFPKSPIDGARMPQAVATSQAHSGGAVANVPEMRPVREPQVGRRQLRGIRMDMPGSEGVEKGVRPASEQRVAPQAEQSNQPGRMRSLAQLFDDGWIKTASRPANQGDPAAARAQEVQQVVDLERAHRLAADMPRTNGAPSVVPPGTMSGVSAASATDVRAAVLSDVMARTEGSQAEAQARSITARGLGALASQRGGTLAVRLDPPSLGEIAIRMNVTNGVVRAELTATNSVSRMMMEKGIEFLRASLEARGLTVERLSVHGPVANAESHSSRSDSSQSQLHQQGGGREEGMEDGRRDAAGRESRGRGGERGRSTPDSQEGTHMERASFKQVLAEDKQ